VKPDFVASPSDVVVYVGSNKKWNGLPYTVKEIAAHLEYDPDSNSKFNDIAILSLTKSLKFTQSIGPACLPTKAAEEYIGQGMIVSGWGTINTGGETPDDLQVVRDIKIVDCEE
jgi:Trypsin